MAFEAVGGFVGADGDGFVGEVGEGEEGVFELFVAGAVVNAAELPAGKLLVFAASGGRKEAEIDLASAPRWDGVAAADGAFYVVGADGTLSCLQGR